MRTPSMLEQLVVHTVLMVVSVAVLYPVLWVVGMALTDSQAFSMDPNPIPTEPTLDNFRAVLGTTDGQGGWLFGRQLGQEDWREL